jgi:hypothetical protein
MFVLAAAALICGLLAVNSDVMAWPIGPDDRVTNLFFFSNFTDAALARRLPASSVLALVVSRGCAAAFHALNAERFLYGETL